MVTLGWGAFFQSAWTLAVVPTAVAIAAVYGFAKLLLEKRKTELEIAKLKADAVAGSARVYQPTTSEIARYGYLKVAQRSALRRAAGLAAVLVAVLLPASVWWSQSTAPVGPGPMSPVVAPEPDITIPEQAPLPAVTPGARRMVWVDPSTKVYHKEGDRYYGNTKNGKFMTEDDAIQAGYREAPTAKKKRKK